MTSPVIAMIGAGNMGSSLIGGLIQNGHPPEKIWATDISAEKLESLKKLFGIQVTTDNAKAVETADIVIFAVKPQTFGPIASALKATIQARKPLVMSIAAGIREASIQQWLGGNIAIVRAMPNTPALIGCGATGLYSNPFVTAEQHNSAESILRGVGIVVWLTEESQMDIVTALSGSGPAYFFLVMEALQQAAESAGLPSDMARLLTIQTALGASRMAIEGDEAPATLRKQVTSPGGTTEAAILVLEDKLRDLFKEALHSAKNRSEELATQLGGHA